MDEDRPPSTVTDAPWVFAHCPGERVSTPRVGKWMVFSPSWEAHDRAWETIRTAVMQGHLGYSAKALSAKQEADTGPLPIMVYTADEDDVDDVRRVLRSLRELGFRQNLTYKADATTGWLYGKGVASWVAAPDSTVLRDCRATVRARVEAARAAAAEAEALRAEEVEKERRDRREAERDKSWDFPRPPR